ncbi:thiamine phosphate synthase [Methanobrevibacter filiformis]|uniref:Thiamine-phosphate synthase n=1 Tax=Methanobrevibacter filiformis TaxID=55758 RepID=A0A166EIC0_9EURY|nr:thiamine phosphate synthase [Methanobrevibacter filiformis]KZX16684.1 thiamine-phosphate synthase [Methanobrevibacter filiformis]
MKKNINYSLYMITDDNYENYDDLSNIITEAIKGGVNILQLREKSSNSHDFYKIAIKINEITKQYNIPLIINDRIDIALAVNSQGVHLGQEDLPAKIARDILGNNKIIGVSAHNVKEAIKAEKDGADYIGVGAVFKTKTKKDTENLSPKKLKEITEQVTIPVIAIGGINQTNIYQLKDTGIEGIAVISAISKSNNVEKTSEELKKEILKIKR